MSMDVEAFDKIAREVFAPAYPLIARQIQERTGINEGVCVDVGCGGGYLGLALAQITRLQVWLLDILPGMLKICQENIRVCKPGLPGQGHTGRCALPSFPRFLHKLGW